MPYRVFVNRVEWYSRVHDDECKYYIDRTLRPKSNVKWLPPERERGYNTVAQAVFEGWAERIYMVQAMCDCIPENLRASYVRVRN